MECGGGIRAAAVDNRVRDIRETARGCLFTAWLGGCSAGREKGFEAPQGCGKNLIEVLGGGFL
jgi:hypothetical protein